MSANIDFYLTPPAGWNSKVDTEWIVNYQDDFDMPEQGWKIHISATLANATEILSRVAQIAYSLGVPFKHLADRNVLIRRNSKMYPREHAGKFIALYPKAAQLETLLIECEEALKDFDGPYILSDRQWNRGPIYLRYGAFRPHKTPTGEESIALIDPTGVEHPDARSVPFSIPNWVSVPTFLQSWLHAQHQQQEDLPFTVTHAYSFSNAGGVYKGIYKGADVVVKEGRPHAGLDAGMRDGFERLHGEAAALASLQGVAGVPSLLYQGIHGGHAFIVQSLLPGEALNRWIMRYNVYYGNDPERFRQYLLDAAIVISGLEALIFDAHAAGWAHMDVHPANILVDPDTLSVGLIDFENSIRIDSQSKPSAMAAPGFGLEGSHTPKAHDLQGVRQVAAYLLWPGVLPSHLDNNHSDIVAERLLVHCPYPATEALQEELSQVTAKILDLGVQYRACDNSATLHNGAPFPMELPDTIEEWKDCLSSGIRHLGKEQAGSPHHKYIVSPRAVDNEWQGVGFGANAINSIVGEPYAQTSTNGSGLWVGITGELLTAPDDVAIEYLDRHWDALLATPGRTVFSGLPGVLLGLATLCLVQDDQRRISDLRHSISKLAVKYLESGTDWFGSSANKYGTSPLDQSTGLLYGHLGVAWCFSRFARDGDREVIQAFHAALCRELDGYSQDAGGTLQLDQGSRRLPYLSTGSAGFAVAISGVPDDQLPGRVLDALPGLSAASAPNVCAFPGLLNGAAGLALAQGAFNERMGRTSPWDSAIQWLNSRLPFFACSSGSGLGVLSDEIPVLSADVATGSAGILLALEALSSHQADPLLALRQLASS